MIYLSAQPEDAYFLWQLEVQHQNFKEVGVNMKDVFALIGVSGDVRKEWIDFKERSEANILFYRDDRETRYYLSSIRPNIIKKFFFEKPELKSEYVFYHDADIIFRELPNFVVMQDGDWHVSNTNSYINYKYITQKGVDILIDMCEVIGIEPKVVKANNENSGGAQYFFTGVDYDFWNKVERDCEQMYFLLGKNELAYGEDWKRLMAKFAGDNYGKLKEGESFEFKYHELQRWCSDMWCVLWNGWLAGHKTFCNPELDFSWGTDRLDRYEKCKIYHNSGIGQDIMEGGVVKYEFFNKEKYRQITPYGIDFKIDPESAQVPYIDLIKRTGNNKYKKTVQEFKITKATWGHHDKRDVSGKVKELLGNIDASFIASNSLFGDHEVGAVKFLTVDYYENGVFNTKNFRENDLVRFSKPKDILGIFYTNNINEEVLNTVFKQIVKIAKNKADIVTCSYKPIQDNPFASLSALNKTGSHFNIMTQILQCLLYAKKMNHYEYVAFLEHDVLYPEDYFDFPHFQGDVLCNWNFIGLNENGWQKKKQNDEPMHQIIMKFDAAIQWFSERLVIALGEGSLLEPNALGIERWDTVNPAVHINHGKHFTSHYNIYSQETDSENSYWGNSKTWYRG